MDLNLLERAWSAVSPRWGAERLAQKITLGRMRSLAADVDVSTRRYAAGRQGRRTAGWFASGGSPTAEIAPALNLVIRRSRDLVRNNEWA
jgi:capsid protein